MNRRILLGTCWLLLTTSGCPTRTIYYDAGADASRGQSTGGPGGGAGRSAFGDASVASNGGQGGLSRESDLGGVAGTSLGGLGAVGGEGKADGGASGQQGGGADGAAGDLGAAGTGGTLATGTGGHDSYEPGSVICGAVMECPVANGGKCCFAQMDQSSACQVAAATCESVMSGTVYYTKTTIQCDSSSDCTGGQICCYSEMYVQRSTSCTDAAACVDAPPPGPGGYATHRRQVCDPNALAPTECLSGSCKVATSYSQVLPSYLYLCL